ncbi:MAG: hypothetical protein M3440_08345 [Chloroflexota bacterium]|nr:hypothetical protein [Chloroflexota bacterium]
MSSAALQAWNESGELTEFSAIQQRYLERWAWSTGTMFQELSRHSRLMGDPRVYANTSLLFKHVESVGDFYGTTIYQGSLSTDGKPLPDGTRGAIPIDPQMEREDDAAALRTGIAEQWSSWNWQQNMTLRPAFVSRLGDGLTELVDDISRGVVYPSMVRPWHVPEIELDFVSNVKAYAVQYDVTEHQDSGQTDHYRFRKEVDKEVFRYFRDDKPHDYGDGDVVANPYGFVPAIWDRHKVGWGERGVAATDGTRQALIQINSLLSHSFDFQRKAFAAPIIVRGRIGKAGQTEITMPGDSSISSPGLIDRLLSRTERRASQAAQSLDVLQGSDDAAIMQAQFDIGKTLEIIAFLKEGILEENPEGSFYHQLREMSQLTGPAAERALGDAVSRCRLARAGYDAQSVKLFQMALGMSGMRANEAAPGTGWAAPLSRRQQAFLPFNLDSYREGKIDFGISDRPVVLPTEQERVEVILAREQIQTRRGLIELGYSEEPGPNGEPSEVDRILDEREAGRMAGQRAFDRGAILAGFSDDDGVA